MTRVEQHTFLKATGLQILTRESLSHSELSKNFERLYAWQPRKSSHAAICGRQ